MRASEIGQRLGCEIQDAMRSELASMRAVEFSDALKDAARRLDANRLNLEAAAHGRLASAFPSEDSITNEQCAERAIELHKAARLQAIASSSVQTIRIRKATESEALRRPSQAMGPAQAQIPQLPATVQYYTVEQSVRLGLIGTVQPTSLTLTDDLRIHASQIARASLEVAPVPEAKPKAKRGKRGKRNAAKKQALQAESSARLLKVL